MNNSKWNDKRKTDAFKSTRKINQSRKERNIRPTNTRVWKNKTQTESKFDNFNNNNKYKNKKDEASRNNVFEPRKWNRKHRESETEMRTRHANNVIEPRKWKGDNRKTERSDAFRSMGSRNDLKSDSKTEPLQINSKWTAKREKKTDTDNIFSTQNVVAKRVPEQKSFNKKIVIIERKTKKQLEAEKKAVYDSFIKESFILKLEDTLGKKDKPKINNTKTDSWYDFDSNEDFSNSTEHLTEFDKWEKNLLEEIDGGSDDYEVVNNRRKQFFSGFFKSFFEYYRLPEQDMCVPKFSYDKSYYDKQHKYMLMRQLRGLSILPAIMVEDNMEEAYESLYEFMISKRMSVCDISFDYDIRKLLEIDDKVLRKEFYKLRKKYNSIKKIQKKLENKEKVQKSEQDKYDSRHECVFLYHRLKSYDEYYMDGELNFTNNTN